ncbi:calcineurin-like phosphoesterase family protein [uncultured Jannaschia sp.]|uniref:calcineurin-like phosphoesterase family protein n=1 Tax=uncultured Jannaschia sp. TaxID=293347 RepID=UPI00260AE188|nr:calcineurin-like phosphoesterase family protein [uncultured Jannaschia sp.]
MSDIRYALFVSTCLFALPALAKDASYVGSVQTMGESQDQTARGTVFLDADRDSQFDEGESGVEGVMVSNGREVVTTGADGSYELSAYDDMNLFITKPADHAVPVNQQMVPQFAYVHKVEGSPDLRFGGIAPTGPLPAEINFPLIEDQVGEQFDCRVFGDPQPYSNTEVGYVRETVGAMLQNEDISKTECLIFEGDIVSDDLSLFPRFKQIAAVGKTPYYFVAGNHDLDLDAESDANSFDTFRREFGPEYYSFDIGQVHFVVLDNVRYPCNGVDDHPFCDPAENPAYNGVIHDRQMAWLENDLENVPQDKLIVLNAHIPFQTYTDNTAAKHQTDNYSDVAEIVGERPALGLSGHTHTTENLLKGVGYEGWEENTGLATAPFNQIVTGAVSGSWWQGDLNDQGVPHATQRSGAPRGFYVLSFDGSDYVESYRAFGRDEDEQLHASFNTPRFREWAEQLLAFTRAYSIPADVTPPVSRNDLGDMYMLTREDLEGGTWAAVNVWNGSRENDVTVRINDGEPITAEQTQSGTGEAKKEGSEWADPLALAKQSTQAAMAVRSDRGGEATAGYRVFKNDHYAGVPGPFPEGNLTDNSQHLWRAELPADLPTGVHTLAVETTDRHGRTYTRSYTFEVVDELPNPDWQASLFE